MFNYLNSYTRQNQINQKHIAFGKNRIICILDEDGTHCDDHNNLNSKNCEKKSYEETKITINKLNRSYATKAKNVKNFSYPLNTK